MKKNSLDIQQEQEYVYINESKRINEETFIPIRDMKLLLRTADQFLIECAFYEIAKNNKKVLHACISTQIGCNGKCLFCANSKNKLKRNLNSDELIDQIICILEKSNIKDINDLAVMGVGEPIENIDNIVIAIKKARELGLLSGNIRISTSVYVEKINELDSLLPNAKLWISLHSADSKKRQIIMPHSKVSDIEKLINFGVSYAQRTNSQVTLQYLILNGFNNSVEDAKKLANLLLRIEEYFIVQLAIPNGKITNTWQTSTADVRRFYNIFAKISLVKCKIFLSKGVDIQAGCGELVTLKI